jgi:hypothetical protein
MNRQGMDHLLHEKLTLGSGAAQLKFAAAIMQSGAQPFL